MSAEEWRRYLARHRGKVVGSVAGLGVGLAIMWLGILWTLFLAFTVGVGYLIGRHWDGDQDGLSSWIERLLPPSRR